LTEEIEWSKVADLEPRSRGVNLRLKAISHTDVREVTSRKDGSTHRVCEVLMGDESAVVLLTVWDDMIEKVEDGKSYALKNGYSSLFQNNLRLNIGRYGEIDESAEAVETVNEEINVSDKTHDAPPRFRRRSYGGGGGGGRYADRG
jgi:replication factor A1